MATQQITAKLVLDTSTAGVSRGKDATSDIVDGIRKQTSVIQKTVGAPLRFLTRKFAFGIGGGGLGGGALSAAVGAALPAIIAGLTAAAPAVAVVAAAAIGAAVVKKATDKLVEDMGAGQKLTFPSPQVTQDDIRRFGMTDPTKGQGTIPLTSDPINQTKVLNEEVGKQIVAYSQIDPKQKQFRDNTKAIVEAHFAAKKPLSELTAELALNEDQVALLNNVMGTNIGVHSQSNVLTDVEFNSILRLNPQKKTEAERRNANASAINKEADAIKRLVRAKELEAGRRFEVPKGSAVDALNVTKGFSFGQMSSKGRISLAPGSLLDNPFNRPNYTPITGSFYNAESF